MMPKYVVARIHTVKTLVFEEVEAETPEKAPNAASMTQIDYSPLCNKYSTKAVLELENAGQEWRLRVLNGIGLDERT